MIRLAFLAALGALLWSPAALAHRVGIPVTTIEWHAPSKAWHVVHRLSAHDFAQALKGLDLGHLESLEEQAAIGRYVIAHFQIVGETADIEVSYLGAEEEADSFYVYFQMTMPDQSVEIKNELASVGDSDDRRHALVNIANGKGTSTLLFTAEDPVKALTLARPEQAP